MADNRSRWAEILRKYRIYIKTERSLSNNTVESYMRDLASFSEFVLSQHDVTPKQVTREMIEEYLCNIFERGQQSSSQARILSSIKSLYTYLTLLEIVENSPAEFVSAPKCGRSLPDTLSTEEIDSIIAVIDISTSKGVRDSAILETLYSCGLRVSELTALRLCDLFFGEGYIRVMGKGDKERLVPISDPARLKIEHYLEHRSPTAVNEETLFLNNRGKPLTRVMIFTIIKNATCLAGITKRVSPHTLRHSFATHMLKGGASIRQVQEMLGHEDITTTEIYTHLDMEDVRRMVERCLPL